jgi:hypothetical protein
VRQHGLRQMGDFPSRVCQMQEVQKGKVLQQRVSEQGVARGTSFLVRVTVAFRGSRGVELNLPGATSVPTNQHRVPVRPRGQVALRRGVLIMTMTMRQVGVVELSLRLVYRVTFSRAPCKRRRQRTGPRVHIGVTELWTSEGGSWMRGRPSRTFIAFWTPMDAVRQGSEPATRRCFRMGCRWTCFGRRCERETVTRGQHLLILRKHAEAPSTHPLRLPLSSPRDREQDSLAHSLEPPCHRRSIPARRHRPPTRHAQSTAWRRRRPRPRSPSRLTVDPAARTLQPCLPCWARPPAVSTQPRTGAGSDEMTPFRPAGH